MSSRPDDWTYNLRAGHQLALTPNLPLLITNAALAAQVFDDNERTCLQYQYIPTGAHAPNAVVVASFFKNRCDNKLLSLKLQAGRRYVLSILGPNDIDLIGYYIPKDGDHDEAEVYVPSLPTKTKATAPTKEARGKPLAKTRSQAKAAAKSAELISNSTSSTTAPVKKPATAKRVAAMSKAAAKRKARDNDKRKEMEEEDLDEETDDQ